MDEIESNPNIKVCPKCGISQIEGVFYWSQPAHKAQSARVSAHPDAVYTRVCQYAKETGCINKKGQLNPSLGYAPIKTSLDHDQMAADILNNISN